MRLQIEIMTIEECIRDDILREFLVRNRAEAKAVSIYEYNEEEHMRMEREQHYQEGHAAGRIEGHAAGLAVGEIYGVIKMCRKFHLPENEIVEELQSRYGMEKEKALELCKQITE